MQTRRTALASLLGASTLWADGKTGGLPNVGLTADTGPIRSESGVGAMMAWADSLWVVTYKSHTRTSGTGLGLYRIEESLKTEKVHVHDGTHANRYIHKESNQCFIGPYAIDMKVNFWFIEALKDVRLTATRSLT